MCGLAGAILGKKRRRREELRVIGGIFTELLLLNQTRGTDATGLAVIRKDGDFKLLKRPGPATQLLEDKLYHAVLDLDNKVTVLLGHTRRKTRGSERNNRNNQPLRVGTGCLATHNGHIFGADALARKLRLPRKAEVDSEVLCRIFDKARGIRKLRRMLLLCRGHISAAYVRLDAPDRLCLLKGNMPLSIAHIPRFRAVFYASEEWMLAQALDGHKWRMLEVDPMTLSTFEVDDLADFTQQDVTFKTPEATLWPMK